ncbi:presenilin-like protein At1g08700 [Cajanus cajan]|uniref:Presenilin n=1 Tax=Cajanus cajan TaxID=3821 RepID=A0A151TAD3_CAJCA|nr:presenilin-like protein At1g08700 [Cajanus cajan]XP_029127938.1 presenilin-like protein At1g08700 [Cajanus cajan]KYP63997.1 Presenilin-like protein At1g08700 family [Cajanus cajan]
MESSVLECVGVEIIGVMSPVSICMFLVVLLVYSLSSPDAAAATMRTVANFVYAENPSDTAAQKLEGALLNALVFVILIAVVTFLLVLLYYYNCTSFLRHYTRFSAFFVLASMGGSILLSLLQRFSIPLDALTSLLLLLNFTVVGVLSVFSAAVPILLRQFYMVCLGIIVAAWFTKLPEWTTWALLVALALYDLVAVLAPGGPLKLLVDLASSRDEELPALVYEARPTVSARNPAALGFLVAGVSDSESSRIELQVVSRDNVIRNSSSDNDDDDDGGDEENGGRGDEGERSPLVGGMSGVGEGEEEDDGVRREVLGERGIKLGLGDFVFYSVLVGRAAMYDLMTVYACYLAIISGLGCTLILLSVCRKALPALPISITLGVLFYFLTRLLMEPFIVGTATNLMMF